MGAIERVPLWASWKWMKKDWCVKGLWTIDYTSTIHSNTISSNTISSKNHNRHLTQERISRSQNRRKCKKLWREKRKIRRKKKTLKQQVKTINQKPTQRKELRGKKSRKGILRCEQSLKPCLDNRKELFNQKSELSGKQKEDIKNFVKKTERQ